MLDVINDPESKVVLRCTKPYTTENKHINPAVSYALGKILPRKEIYLKPGHWTFASKRATKKLWDERKSLFLNGCYN